VIVTLTGASGFIGRALAERLAAAGHQVQPFSLRSPQALKVCDALIHLAGEPIAQRWTPEAKRRIRESRIEGTRRLIGALPAPPRVFICSSAVGFYGSRGDEVLTEASAPVCSRASATVSYTGKPRWIWPPRKAMTMPRAYGMKLR